jgi:hypothetical protein
MPEEDGLLMDEAEVMGAVFVYRNLRRLMYQSSGGNYFWRVQRVHIPTTSPHDFHNGTAKLGFVQSP